MADVLKVINQEERDRIEQWTIRNTFPNIIVFQEDEDGNFIVGEEVLNDIAYTKLGLIDGEKEESLKEYITAKTERILYKPKTEDREEDREEDKVSSLGRMSSKNTENITATIEEKERRSILSRILDWIIAKFRWFQRK